MPLRAHRHRQRLSRILTQLAGYPTARSLFLSLPLPPQLRKEMKQARVANALRPVHRPRLPSFRFRFLSHSVKMHVWASRMQTLSIQNSLGHGPEYEPVRDGDRRDHYCARSQSWTRTALETRHRASLRAARRGPTRVKKAKCSEGLVRLNARSLPVVIKDEPVVRANIVWSKHQDQSRVEIEAFPFLPDQVIVRDLQRHLVATI